MPKCPFLTLIGPALCFALTAWMLFTAYKKCRALTSASPRYSDRAFYGQASLVAVLVIGALLPAALGCWLFTFFLAVFQ